MFHFCAEAMDDCSDSDLNDSCIIAGRMEADTITSLKVESDESSCSDNADDVAVNLKSTDIKPFIISMQSGGISPPSQESGSCYFLQHG